VKLKYLTGKTSSFIKYSFNCIHKTSDIQLDDQDLMINFDVFSLVTKILVARALDLISKMVDPETLNLIDILLTYTFLTFNNIYYE
jgi:hypothetical protein